MHPPRLLLILALAASPLLSRAVTETAPKPELPSVDIIQSVMAGPDVEPEKPGVQVNKDVAKALEKIGWKVEKDGSLTRKDGADKGLIPKGYLDKADLEWKDGFLIYSGSPQAVPSDLFARQLKGLWTFTDAARADRAKAGAALAAWGFSPSIDGKRIYNPNGEATYFGLMLFSIFTSKPDAVAKLGIERTSQALELLDHAYAQAFYHQAADIAQGDYERAKHLLFMAPRTGETPLGDPALKAKQDPAAMLKDYKAKLEADLAVATKAGDQNRRKDSAEALAVLNTLERQRLNASLDLAVVPVPAAGSHTQSVEEKKDEPYANLSGGLPTLLRVLDRVNGTPLTAEQKESVIKSFPMGDIVWRMGAQDLWQKGLTGKGVKIAIIDEGVAEHPELDGSVVSRQNFTAQRGKAAVGSHGTHVAGIIRALAPDAKLSSYAVLSGDGANPELKENPEQGIVKAVRAAVKDGNRVINMSLGSSQGPSAELARVVEEYASKGVIFVIAAGNSRNQSGGIDSPASAPHAITVGALDANGRMADYTNFGERFDPRKLTTVVKDVFMAPGSNIVSTMPGSSSSFGPKTPQYAAMSGTSMATPAMSGVSALLVQDMGGMSLLSNPVKAAERLKAILIAGSEPMSLDRLPPGVPIDQPFYVVNPLKAYEALHAPAVADGAPGGNKSPAGSRK